MRGGSRFSLRPLKKRQKIAGDIGSITEGLLVTMVTVATKHWTVSLLDFYYPMRSAHRFPIFRGLLGI